MYVYKNIYFSLVRGKEIAQYYISKAKTYFYDLNIKQKLIDKS